MSAVHSSTVDAPVLSARSLRKTYLSGSQRLEVLRDVTVDVKAGESVSISGESDLRRRIGGRSFSGWCFSRSI